MTEDIRQWIVGMPKAELHVHLEGTTDPATLLRLAHRYGRQDELPGTNEEALRDWMAFTSFPDFVDKYLFIVSLLRTQDDVRLLVEACGRDMAEQGIRYREVTVTPYLHVDSQEKDLSFDELLAGLEAGRAAAKVDHDVEMRWVFDIPRNSSFLDDDVNAYDGRPAEQTVSYALAAVDHGCVGLGLGGHEVSAPPHPFAHAFSRAKEAGLLSVPHAGETMGPSSIWGAIRELKADRIGHGVRAIEDPELLLYLKEQQIPLEVSITSNVCLHVYPSAQAHPFLHLDRLGLFVTLNSDDPPLFDTLLVDEYMIVHQVFGCDKADLARLARRAFAACGADHDTKSKLFSEFEHWTDLNLTSE